jgi:hypothetical protein
MFWHPRLKLLLGVYVDDFKMSGPAKNVEEGWKFIASQIDMDTPEDAGRYFGCEHAFKQMTRFAHGKPARSRPERHVVLRFVLELLARLQVVMNTNTKLRDVLPVIPRSAGRTGWLTRWVRDACIKDMGKRVSAHIQFDILFEDMFTS